MENLLLIELFSRPFIVSFHIERDVHVKDYYYHRLPQRLTSIYAICSRSRLLSHFQPIEEKKKGKLLGGAYPHNFPFRSCHFVYIPTTHIFSAHSIPKVLQIRVNKVSVSFFDGGRAPPHTKPENQFHFILSIRRIRSILNGI